MSILLVGEKSKWLFAIPEIFPSFNKKKPKMVDLRDEKKFSVWTWYENEWSFMEENSKRVSKKIFFWRKNFSFFIQRRIFKRKFFESFIQICSNFRCSLFLCSCKILDFYWKNGSFLKKISLLVDMRRHDQKTWEIFPNKIHIYKILGNEKFLLRIKKENLHEGNVRNHDACRNRDWQNFFVHKKKID